MKKEVLLFSPGLDSYLAYHYLVNSGHRVERFFIDYKGCYSEAESMHIKELYGDDGDAVVIEEDAFDLLEYEDEKTAHLPNRNLLFITLAHMNFNPDIIWLGGTKTDNVNDNNEDFYCDASELFTGLTDKDFVVVDSPFPKQYKHQLMWKFVDRENINGRPRSEILEELNKNTFSCYSPKLHDPCGSISYHYSECHGCKACFRKSVELNHVGLFRPFENDDIVASYVERCATYTKNPHNIVIQEYLDKLKNA